MGLYWQSDYKCRSTVLWSLGWASTEVMLMGWLEVDGCSLGVPWVGIIRDVFQLLFLLNFSPLSLLLLLLELL